VLAALVSAFLDSLGEAEYWDAIAFGVSALGWRNGDYSPVGRGDARDVAHHALAPFTQTDAIKETGSWLEGRRYTGTPGGRALARAVLSTPGDAKGASKSR
jgi:hypothetical protein